MNAKKKELVAAIEQSLLSQCQAMFDSLEWKTAVQIEGGPEEELIRNMLKACARNVASYTQLEE